MLHIDIMTEEIGEIIIKRFINLQTFQFSGKYDPEFLPFLQRIDQVIGLDCLIFHCDIIVREILNPKT
jgi:hypothetical protein